MIRLYRILPLLIVLAVIAVAMYLIMSFRYSSDRAKATLIKAFFWIFVVLSIVFAVITAYALFDQNMAVTELFGSCLAVCVIGLGVTLICRAVFRRHHPHYGTDKTTTATFVHESLGTKFGKAFAKAFGEALKDVFKPGSKR